MFTCFRQISTEHKRAVFDVRFGLRLHLKSCPDPKCNSSTAKAVVLSQMLTAHKLQKLLSVAKGAGCLQPAAANSHNLGRVKSVHLENTLPNPLTAACALRSHELIPAAE